MIINKGTKEMRLIYDPIQIKIIERDLKRPLDELEKAGEKSVWYNGRLIFLQISQIVFPYDLMPTTYTPSPKVNEIRNGDKISTAMKTGWTNSGTKDKN